MVATYIGIAAGLASAVIAETLLRTRERRFLIEDAVLELGMELPIYQARFVPQITDLPYDSNFGETWAQGQRVLRLINRIRALSRFPIRRYRKIRHEISHLGAQVFALEHRASVGNWLRLDEIVDQAGDRLFHLVFGKRPQIDDLLTRYQQGLPRE